MPRPPDPTVGSAGGSVLAERFAHTCAGVVSCLPGRLPGVVPPSLVGFAVINGFTFGVDLLLLSALHGGLGWPVPVAVTVAYTAASMLAFVLNRALNFRSHAPVGPQTARYVVVLAANFAVLLLGVTTALAAVGVQYQVARVLAGVCEGVWVYCAMRWIVFRAA